MPTIATVADALRQTLDVDMLLRLAREHER
jgi:hypothetical protein